MEHLDVETRQLALQTPQPPAAFHDVARAAAAVNVRQLGHWVLELLIGHEVDLVLGERFRECACQFGGVPSHTARCHGEGSGIERDAHRIKCKGW